MPQWIVIGAGASGLSTAALLAQAGIDVRVIEAIHYPGGCASSYEDAGGAWFDVGATVFCGMDEDMPLRTLCQRLGAVPDLIPHDPSLVAVLDDGQRVTRWQDRGRWVAEAERVFGAGQRAFWTDAFDTADWAYALTRELPHVPPITIGDYIRDALALRPRHLRNPFKLLRRAEKVLRAHDVDNPRFRTFVDEQLMITNQVGADRSRWMTAAMGLTYTNAVNYTVRGGMIGFARWLEERVVSNGGEVVYNQRVTGIEHDGERFTVKTRRGEVFEADGVITSIPIWNVASIVPEAWQRRYARRVQRLERSGAERWGAFTIYGLLEGLGENVPLHWQVHSPELAEHGGGGSLFVSLSPPEDPDRAPGGMRTMTISTHTRPEPWLELRRKGAAYREAKERLGDAILASLRHHVPEVGDAGLVSHDTGTPSTFKQYTKREAGSVGGVPLDHRVFPFRMPMPRGAHPRLLHVGDTFFPGQGLPGVVLGALGVADHVLRRERGRLPNRAPSEPLVPQTAATP